MMLPPESTLCSRMYLDAALRRNQQACAGLKFMQAPSVPSNQVWSCALQAGLANVAYVGSKTIC